MAYNIARQAPLAPAYPEANVTVPLDYIDEEAARLLINPCRFALTLRSKEILPVSGLR